MNQPWDIIKNLASDNSRLFKEGVIMTEIESNNDTFFEGCKFALDKLITFGVKQVPEATVDGPGLTWNEFFVDLASPLSKRDITGHEARDTIIKYMEKATVDQWNNWYRLLLLKDLKCGTSEKTINSQAKKSKRPEYIVPTFTCQLAHDSANHEKKLAGTKQIEIKLDGVRVITIIKTKEHGGTVEMFSRNGKQFHNFDHICEQIKAVADFEEDMVLDGEVMSDNFQDLMKQVHRKSSAGAVDAVLYLFDLIPLSYFKKGHWDEPQSKRSDSVKVWVEANSQTLTHVRGLEWEDVDLDSPQGQARFKEINKLAVEGGYEGVMIKDIEAGYDCKRSHAWLKMKPFIEVSLEVKATEEGTGKNVGKLGALVCEGTDDGKDIKVNVGSGLTDDQRDSFWADKQALIGQIAEVRADAVTQNQDGTYSLRFPRFKTFRGFEAGEKI